MQHRMRIANNPLDPFNTYPNGMLAVDVDRLTNRWIALRHRQIPVYVPPQIPALGDTSAFDDLRTMPQKTRQRLVSCVGERFYMPYASLLALDAVSGSRTKQIDAYLATRQGLADDLRRHLGDIAALSPIDRADRLASFARSQLPALEALEVESARIHADLTTNGILKASDDGRSLRAAINELDHEVDKEQRAPLLAFEAAFYHPGLSVWQRTLLHEFALEHALNDAEPTATAAATRPSFFLPATARIPLGPDLPPDVAEDLRRFTALKSALKADLWTVVVNEDFVVTSSRTAQYQKLAAQQKPTRQELEALAERIRSRLIGLPSFQPPQSRLPRRLIAELGAALERKREWEAELASVARQLTAAAKQEIEVRDGDLPALQFVPDADKPTGKSRVDRKTQARLLAANEKFAKNYRIVLDRIESLRPLVDQFAAESHAPTRRTSDELLAEIHEAFRTHRKWARYRDYHTAVLQPGLSPEQRSLLYRVALADLAGASTDASEAFSTPSK